jgi:DNA polymerase I-like protein with 3'-5' exonuclease and polymerase domains
METLSVVPKAHAYECVELIKQCSLDAGKDLKVPLSCDVEISDNWYGTTYTFNDKHELVLTK